MNINNIDMINAGPGGGRTTRKDRPLDNLIVYGKLLFGIMRKEITLYSGAIALLIGLGRLRLDKDNAYLSRTLSTEPAAAAVFVPA